MAREAGTPTDAGRPGALLSRVVERFGVHQGYLYFLTLWGSLAKGPMHAAPK
jgi:hypothetical protein